MNEKLKAIEMYESKEGFEKYSKSVDEIGLWISEKVIMEKYVDKNASILDLGCGCGRTTFGFYNLGYKNIIGTDLCEKYINYANELCKNKKCNISFLCCDSCNLPFKDAMFDCVFYSFNGIQLIPGYNNRLNVLKEAYRLLRNNGCFIFTAHNRDEKEFKQYWDNELKKWNSGINPDNLECFGDMNIYEHGGNGFIHYSSIDEMIDMINNTDFHIVEHIKRSDIANESQTVKNWSSDTIFWVLRKENTK